MIPYDSPQSLIAFAIAGGVIGGYLWYLVRIGIPE